MSPIEFQRISEIRWLRQALEHTNALHEILDAHNLYDSNNMAGLIDTTRNIDAVLRDMLATRERQVIRK